MFSFKSPTRWTHPPWINTPLPPKTTPRWYSAVKPLEKLLHVWLGMSIKQIIRYIYY